MLFASLPLFFKNGGCFLKDILVTMLFKRSPLVLRMVVLLFVMVCGLYVLSICTKQSSNLRDSNILRVRVFNPPRVFDRPCIIPKVEEEELPFLHFPKPKTFSRKECACNPVRYFAILSMQRSGSGWFETFLNSHINVSSNGEIFSVRDRRTNVSEIISTMDKVYNLDWFNSASKNECSAAVGFKWMLNQGLMENHEEIVDYFKNRGVHAIFLFRRNLLRRMISVLANSYDKEAKLLNRTHKSHVHSQKEAQILARYKPTINVTSLIPTLKEDEQTIAKALEYFKSTRHIVLHYEDIVSNRTKLVDVQKFLKLPLRELTSRQVRIHRGPLSKQIENWKDVRKVLKGTSYKTFLRTHSKT